MMIEFVKEYKTELLAVYVVGFMIMWQKTPTSIGGR